MLGSVSKIGYRDQSRDYGYVVIGIPDAKLPWKLVLFGVMIAVALEIAGIPSPRFAVGVYLPLSSSTPIFIGGMVRWLIGRKQRHTEQARIVSDAELIAETDKGAGVPMASGYIAGGAIAGIFVALPAAEFVAVDTWFIDCSTRNNPFFQSAYSDALSMLPFVALVVLPYLAARSKVFSGATKFG